MKHPELLQSLTLAEPPVTSLLEGVPGGDSAMTDFFTNAFLPASAAFQSNNELQGVKIFISGVMGDSTYFSRMPEKDRQMMMANTLETRGTLFSGKQFPTVTCNDVKSIKAPVLLIMGEKSPPFLTLITKQLNACLTNRELVVLPNTSHGLEYENPSGFNKAVVEFINKHGINN